MPVELIVDPTPSGELPQKTISVMLWATGEDPRLVDAKVFVKAADFRTWLKDAAATFGAENIKVRWSMRLRANAAVCGLIAACLGTTIPSE